MFARTRPRRLATWMTLVVMLLAALAPGVSRAVSFAQGQVAPWDQVCSATASLSASTSSPTSEAPATSAAHALDHCPFCSLQGDSAWLPLVTSNTLIPSALAHAVPRLFLQARRTLPAWAQPPLRGPPNLS